MAAYWEIAAHSAYDMFSKYKYLIVNLLFATPVFAVGISFYLLLFLIIAYLYLLLSLNTEQKKKRNNYIPLNFEQTMIQSEIIVFSTSA